MAADGKVPVVESARAGYVFMRASARTVAPAAAVTAALTSVLAMFAPGPPAPTPQWVIVSLVTLVVGAIYAAFLFRLALRQDASGSLFGLRTGRDEANLIGAQAIVLIVALIGMLLWARLFAEVLARAAIEAAVDLGSVQPGDPVAVQALMEKLAAAPSAPFLLVIILVGMAIAAWLGARLCLVAAATIGEGKVMVFSTWAWTKGNVLRILAATALTALPLVLLLSLLRDVLLLSFGQTQAPGAVLIIAAFVLALLQNMTLLPAVAGLSAHLYRGLRPPDLPRGNS